MTTIQQIIYPVALLVPILILFLSSVVLRSIKTENLTKVVSLTAGLGILATLLGVYGLYQYQAIESHFIGIADLGFKLRLDSLSLAMYFVVSTITLIVVNYSKNYLDGESRQSEFIRRISVTIGFVLLFILSSNLVTMYISWVAISLNLHKLILFYPERKQAQAAARKKFIIARLGDTTFLLAIVLLYLEFGTGSLSEIFTKTTTLDPSNLPNMLSIATVLLVITAVLKSAQFPLHIWLIDVIEAPTPVSALLHAGLLNAGPYLMLRFSNLLDVTPFASSFLVIVGAITAVYGTIVYSKQSSIKTALVYSSIGHMGFSLMLSGLGLYSASLLHLIAHSFYKAHAFLSSGSMIDKVRVQYGTDVQRKQNPIRTITGVLLAFGIYFSANFIWTTVGNNASIHDSFIGVMLLLGLLIINTYALDSNITIRSFIRTVIGSLLFVITFLVLESSTTWISKGVFATSHTNLNTLGWIGTILFLLVILIRIVPQSTKTDSIRSKLDIHLKNGLYINPLMDRILLSLDKKTKI